MSLEPITKKDIESLFNKILRARINRQKITVCQLNIRSKTTPKGENNAKCKM